ncbi:MAG: NAD-dependent malic enzyme [Planctomycetes bacterium]|nr:NAD-dependent malic enzyme [Planctomycetota bacterium]
MAILHNPALNKGTAFTDAERDALGLRGLLPPHVATQELQMERILENFHRLPDDLERYKYLAALLNRNESLFFRVLIDHPDEIMPVVYTPTVGLACQLFGHIFERPRGMFLCADDRGRMAEVLRNWPYREVSIIVVSDGERILGLGDLGANGMGIPVGKLALYTAAAGIPPSQCLPILLDVGTENRALLADPLYVGLRRPRLRGAEYDAFLEEFVLATQEVFPGVLVQFEDFATSHAFELLRRYRDRICTFNDDIQGTAAVTMAGFYSALRVTGGRLADQRILCLGAGEAATGICDLVTAAMRAEAVPDAQARARCWLFNSKGLVVKARTDLAPHHRPYAHDHVQLTDFLAAVETLKPTAIVGVSGVAHAFTQPIVEAMTRLNPRPIVFALSNPTSKSECSAEEAYRWSRGRALFASGSPFPPVTLDGRTLVPRQGNNCYIFPGVGLGVIAAGARHVTHEMFSAAAVTLAGQVTEVDLAQGSLYPPLGQVREVSARIAAAVAEVAYRHGLATRPEPKDLLGHIQSLMFDPRYRSYV